jgi:solute carrier family 25 folate transporter 32
MISGDVAINNLVAGAVSGAVATGVTAPLELVKTVRQGVVSSPTSSVEILKERINHGGARACFRGLTPSLLGIVPHSGVFFLLYSPLKDRFRSSMSESGSSAVAALTAGSVANVITNPLWVVKSRMTNMPDLYPSTLQSLRKLWIEERWTGLRSGVGASVFGVTHVVIQFPLYEKFKELHADPTSVIAILNASVWSKLIATGLTYPLDLLRTRMQTSGKAGMQEALNCTKQVLENHGYRGFFHGFQAQVAKTVPATMITLYLYERLVNSLSTP